MVNEDRINSQLLNPIETKLVGNFPTDPNRGGNIDPAFECSFPGDSNNTDNTDLKSDDNANELLQTSTDKLIQAQKLDKSISHLLQSAVTYKPTDNIPLGYYCLDNGVLMRKWRPSTEPSDQEWHIRNQIVLPKPYQRHVVELAHDSPLSGHFGTRKTTLRILEHFYWPGILSYVKRFCRTCHTCQRIGKPNKPIPRAYLQPIPAFDEPFGKIIIDVVGPLPKSKTGKEYLLTIMCLSTRFPEAIPLKLHNCFVYFIQTINPWRMVFYFFILLLRLLSY